MAEPKMCPGCKKTTESIAQAPGVTGYSLEGTTVTLVVESHELCEDCCATTQTRRFRFVEDLSDRLAAHQGEGHKIQIHPMSCSVVKGGVGVEYTLVCSCGYQTGRDGVGTREYIHERKPEAGAGGP